MCLTREYVNLFLHFLKKHILRNKQYFDKTGEDMIPASLFVFC